MRMSSSDLPATWSNGTPRFFSWAPMTAAISEYLAADSPVDVAAFAAHSFTCAALLPNTASIPPKACCASHVALTAAPPMTARPVATTEAGPTRSAMFCLNLPADLPAATMPACACAASTRICRVRTALLAMFASLPFHVLGVAVENVHGGYHGGG